MSEIRKTTTIEDISIREPEPVRTIAQLLAGMGRMVLSRNSLQRKERSASVSGKTAVSMTVGLSPLVRLQSIMRSAKSASEAASLIAQQIPLQIVAKDAEQWEKSLQNSIQKNDIPSLIRTVGQLAKNQQERSRLQIVLVTANVLAQRGFTDQIKHDKDGIIVARKPGSSQMMTIEVARSKDGTIGMHYDLDGFHGGACIDELNGVQSDLAALGVKTATTSSQPKDPRRAFDGRRIGTVLQQGH